jgi:hypothetical protein
MVWVSTHIVPLLPFYGVISFVIVNNLLGKVLVLDNLALDVNFFLKSSAIGDIFCSQVSTWR